MFRNEFSEGATGIIRLEDISEKNMKILLRYWYTGELLPSLFDEDTVVEFTYAAGKYQMTDVLQLLNETIGQWNFKNVSKVDVQLLDLSEKLSLEKMEANLLKRIDFHIRNTEQKKDLLNLFGWDAVCLDENDLSIEDALKLVEDLIGNTDMVKASKMELPLLWKVQKLGLKSLEAKFLERISIIVSKAKCASELFEIVCPPRKSNGDL